MQRWIIIFLTLYTAPSAYAQLEDYRQNFLKTTTHAFEDWEAKNGVFVMPSSIDQVVASLVNFKGTYCFEGNTQEMIEQCTLLINDHLRLENLITSYLDETFLVEKPKVKTVFARAASAMGSSAGASGWPEMEANENWLFEIPQSYRGANLRLIAAANEHQIPDHTKRLGLPVGEYVLVLGTREGQHRFRLNISMHSNPQLEIADQLGSVMQVFPDLSQLCFDNEALGKFDNPYYQRHPEQSPSGRFNPVGGNAKFTSAVILDIDIADPEGICDSGCRSALILQTAGTILIWKNVCRKCKRSLFMLIRSGETLLLHRQVFRIFRYSQDHRAQFVTLLNMEYGDEHGSNYQLPDDLKATKSSYYAAGDPTGGYELLSRSDPIIGAICHQNNVGNSSGVAVLHDVICGKSDQPKNVSDSLKVGLKLVNGQTSCSTEPTSTVACAHLEGEVELNVLNFTFRVQTSEGQMIFVGKGKRQVPLATVLLHEVGHWFGLPHSNNEGPRDGRANIMSSTYNLNGMCLASYNMDMIDNATSTYWEYRLKKCNGLVYPAR